MEQVHAAVFQARPRSAGSDPDDSRHHFGIKNGVSMQNGVGSGAGAPGKPSHSGSKVADVVWEPFGRSPAGHEWLLAFLAPKDGENALVLASESGTKERARIPLTKSLKWQRHKPTVGILYHPPRALGSLAFHFESSHQADVLTQLVLAAISHSTSFDEGMQLVFGVCGSGLLIRPCL
jgi:hypothetical protein